MGLWILEDKVMDHVPGTTRYFDKPQEAGRESDSHLKRDTSGSVPIILVPQPSDDPNDPLNWPLWRRDVIMIILSLTAIFATALGPILAAVTLQLAGDMKITTTAAALLTGYFLMGVGFAGTFFVPSARKWGKRHLLIFGTVLLVASSAWGGAAGLNHTSMLWARIFQGIANAPFEALINAIVGDLFFVHERGKRMAVTNLALFGGAFFTPILAGKISDSLGIPWIFYFVAIFCALCLPAIIFFVPETAYNRDPRLNTDMLAASESTQDVTFSSGLEPTTSNGNAATGDEADKPENASPSTEAALPPHRYPGADTPKRTFIQSLKPFNGTYTHENFFKIFFRPFPLFFHPAIFWACLIQGTLIGWTIFIGILVASIFLGSPNYWGPVENGYSYTGPFIGALIGFLMAGALADWSAKFMTRRNGGIYEPEFRIVLVIPQLIFGCAGLYGFGIVSTDLNRYHWAWSVFFYCLEVMGMVVGAVASSLYIVDAHRNIAIEAFTCLLIFKNFFSFGLTFSAFYWVSNNNTREVFMIISSVQIVICLLSIPMYVFGKRNRSFFHRHDILKITHLD
ncbi:hypothetical protein O988_07049 [Pseudogymnoascus sp. VKM F-3808]|nr:hypothetical protein O988_07049 [Pseudogymnoascus sp. VKM F-3808]